MRVLERENRKAPNQHRTFSSCRRKRATPPLPLSRLRSSTSTPKPRAEGSSPSAPAKNREASTMLASLFFVSAHKDSATRCGCALRSACRGGLQPGGLRPGPTEAAAETSPSLDFLLAFRVFSPAHIRLQPLHPSPAPKTHPVCPFWTISGAFRSFCPLLTCKIFVSVFVHPAA